VPTTVLTSRTLTEPAWFTVSQLSQRWQLSRKTIYKFIDSKLLPAWRASTHLYRVAAADVLRFEVRNRIARK
jgi:excisionase family DNA binding protein